MIEVGRRVFPLAASGDAATAGATFSAMNFLPVFLLPVWTGGTTEASYFTVDWDEGTRLTFAWEEWVGFLA